MCNHLRFCSVCAYKQTLRYRSWQNVLGGAQLGRAKPRGAGETPWKFLKFSFLKSLQMHPILKTSSYEELIYYYFFSVHLSIIFAAPPLAKALHLVSFSENFRTWNWKVREKSSKTFGFPILCCNSFPGHPWSMQSQVWSGLFLKEPFLSRIK